MKSSGRCYLQLLAIVLRAQHCSIGTRNNLTEHLTHCENTQTPASLINCHGNTHLFVSLLP